MGAQSSDPAPGAAPDPAVLLTRPAEEGARFAAALRARFGPGLRIVESPLMAPEILAPSHPAPPHAGVVLTSAAGAEAARRLGLAAGPAFCVGARTAAAARAAGFAPVAALGGDAEALVTALLDLRPPGPLLHLHGQETRGEVAARLSAEGLPATGLAVYAQRPQPPTPEARALLAEPAPVVVPLFSPRSAALFSELLAGARAPVWAAALSPAVASALAPAPARLTIAARPEAAAMLEALALFLPTPRRGA